MLVLLQNNGLTHCLLCGGKRPTSPRTKKADVAEHPKAFNHVGLLVNQPPGTAELLFI
jgi:hypothetical protein